MFPVKIKDWGILGILGITGLRDDYKTRVGVWTSKNNEVEQRLKKNYNMSSLNNDKKKALEKLTQDHPDVSNVLFYHKFSSCHGLSALFL